MHVLKLANPDSKNRFWNVRLITDKRLLWVRRTFPYHRCLWNKLPHFNFRCVTGAQVLTCESYLKSSPEHSYVTTGFLMSSLPNVIARVNIPTWFRFRAGVKEDQQHSRYRWVVNAIDYETLVCWYTKCDTRCDRLRRLLLACMTRLNANGATSSFTRWVRPNTLRIIQLKNLPTARVGAVGNQTQWWLCRLSWPNDEIARVATFQTHNTFCWFNHASQLDLHKEANRPESLRT